MTVFPFSLLFLSMFMVAFGDLTTNLDIKFDFEPPSNSLESTHGYSTSVIGSLTYTNGRVGSKAANVSAGYINMPDLGAGSFAFRDALTIAAWVKLYVPMSSQNSMPTILMRRENWGLRFQVNQNYENFPQATLGQLYFDVWNMNGIPSVNVVWPVNTWFHVAGTYDRFVGKLRVYVNGVLNNEKNFNQQIGWLGSNPSRPFYIGRDGANSGYEVATLLKGELDDVRLYHRQLSTDEINQLMNLNPPTSAPTVSFASCYNGFYCDGDTDAIRGTFTNAQDCFDACVSQGSSLGKDYKFFDVTTDSQQSCWCGETCNARVPYATTGYSMRGGRCLTDAPTFAPTVTPSLRPSQPPTEYPTQSPTHPTESPSEAPSDSPTLFPSAAPTDSPTTSEPTEEPTLTPSQAPTNTYSFCSEGLYCDGDVSAMRGLFTAAQCYDRCTSLNQGFKFFDVTDQGQCWCGKSCDSFLPFSTTGYRMDAGVCPAGIHVNTETPTVSPSTASRRLRTRDED